MDEQSSMLIECFEELFDDDNVDVHEFDGFKSISSCCRFAGAPSGAILYRPEPNDLR